MFRNMNSVGTSNMNEHAPASDNNGTKSVEVKIERVSVEEVEIEIQFDGVIKQEVDVDPLETSYEETHSEPSQNQNSNECNGSIVTLEIEAMPTVKQEQTEQLYADRETNWEMVDKPVMLQAAALVKEVNDASLKGEQRLKIQRNTDPRGGTSSQVIDITPWTSFFTCNDCGEMFKRKLHLVKHIETHEKLKHQIYLQCKDCAYQTLTRDSLERHETVHDKSRPFVCDVCGYRFKYKGTLKTHLLSVHSGERVHKCSICDYRANRMDHLNAHQQVHSGEKPYACSLCEYRCSVKSDLAKHERIHSGDKPYSCTVCDYKCSTKCNLTSHLRIHSGVKPYSCTMCEYKCNSKTTLRIHLRIHSGEKPFSCNVCSCKFTVRCNLNRHLKTHEGKTPYSCSICDFKCNSKTALKTHARIHTVWPVALVGSDPAC